MADQKTEDKAAKPAAAEGEAKPAGKERKAAPVIRSKVVYQDKAYLPGDEAALQAAILHDKRAQIDLARLGAIAGEWEYKPASAKKDG